MIQVGSIASWSVRSAHESPRHHVNVKSHQAHLIRRLFYRGDRRSVRDGQREVLDETEDRLVPAQDSGIFTSARHIFVGHMTVYYILRSSGPNRPPQAPRVKRTYRHWQRKNSNNLRQCDLKQTGARRLITNVGD
jgi:hypothetical protein